MRVGGWKGAHKRSHRAFGSPRSPASPSPPPRGRALFAPELHGEGLSNRVSFGKEILGHVRPKHCDFLSFIELVDESPAYGIKIVEKEGVARGYPKEGEATGLGAQGLGNADHGNGNNKGNVIRGGQPFGELLGEGPGRRG